MHESNSLRGIVFRISSLPGDQVTHPPTSARGAPIATHPGMAMGASVPRDVQEFLDDYPDLRDNRFQSDNLNFYSNKLKCQPDRKLISEIHEECVSRSCAFSAPAPS